MRRALPVLTLLVLLVGGLAPLARADVSAQPAAAPTAAPAAPDGAGADAEVEPPADGAPGDDAPADEPGVAPPADDAPAEAPTEEAAFDADADGTADGSDGIPTSPGDGDGGFGGGPANPGEDPSAPARPVPGDGETDGDVPAEEPTDEAGSTAEPVDVVVIAIDQEGYCELIEDLGGEGLPDEIAVEVEPGAASAAEAAPSYDDLVAQVDAVLADNPGAVLVSATYDGTSLVVVLVPDVSECEGFEEFPAPEPVDDLDDVEVITDVLSDEDVCALRDELGDDLDLSAPTADDLLSDEVLADLLTATYGPDLPPEQLDALLGLAGELDGVLASTPGGWVDVTYDGQLLFVSVIPDPATVDCDDDPVVAQPLGNAAPPGPLGGAAGGGDDEQGGVLARTGFDTPGQAAVGSLVMLLGVALVRLGRRRYRGAHLPV